MGGWGYLSCPSLAWPWQGDWGPNQQKVKTFPIPGRQCVRILRPSAFALPKHRMAPTVNELVTQDPDRVYIFNMHPLRPCVGATQTLWTLNKVCKCCTQGTRAAQVRTGRSQQKGTRNAQPAQPALGPRPVVFMLTLR